MMKSPLFILFFLVNLCFSQTIPTSRTVDWTLAGNQPIDQNNQVFIEINDFGADNLGVNSCNSALVNAIASLNSQPGIIHFGDGVYVFDQAINLPSNIQLKGNGADNTTLRFVAPATGDIIGIKGSIDIQQTEITQTALKNQNYIVVNPNHNFVINDWVRILLNDSHLVTSSWALNTVGQICEIEHINNDTLFLKSNLRMAFPDSLNPWVQRINPVKNVGIECLKIVRGVDDNFQSNTIGFENAVNCWVKGIESDSCNFAHIAITASSNIKISNSYFKHAYGYGSGGQAYGVLVQFTSGENLIENNVFEHLRHAMILQAGANGNVFAYNYSKDAYWTDVSLPASSAGDMVLHGNYVFANLFEGNIAQQAVIDDSHGMNGPFNTFFRNRMELYGVLMNNNPASNSQNIVGNEIVNTGFTLGLFMLAGNDHFIYGNTVKGNLNPSGTADLLDTSYYLTSKPLFLEGLQYPTIGVPTTYQSGKNRAFVNYGNSIYTYCEDSLILTVSNNVLEQNIFYPNPTDGLLYFDKQLFQFKIKNIELVDVFGNSCTVLLDESNGVIDISNLNSGIYLLRIFNQRENLVLKVIKK